MKLFTCIFMFLCWVFFIGTMQAHTCSESQSPCIPFIRGDIDEDGDVDYDDANIIAAILDEDSSDWPSNCDAIDVDDDGDFDEDDYYEIYDHMEDEIPGCEIAPPNVVQGEGWDPTPDSVNEYCDLPTSFDEATGGNPTYTTYNIFGFTAWPTISEGDFSRSNGCGSSGTSMANQLKIAWTIQYGEPFTFELIEGEIENREYKAWAGVIDISLDVETFQGTGVCSTGCSTSGEFTSKVSLLIPRDSLYKFQITNTRTSTSYWTGYRYFDHMIEWGTNEVRSNHIDQNPDCNCNGSPAVAQRVMDYKCVESNTINHSTKYRFILDVNRAYDALRSTSKQSGDTFKITGFEWQGIIARYKVSLTDGSGTVYNVFPDGHIYTTASFISCFIDHSYGDVFSFCRGDVNGDGHVTSTDESYLSELLSSTQYYYWPTGLDACDANDDGEIDSDDVTYVHNYINHSGTKPANPFDDDNQNWASYSGYPDYVDLWGHCWYYSLSDEMYYQYQGLDSTPGVDPEADEMPDLPEIYADVIDMFKQPGRESGLTPVIPQGGKDPTPDDVHPKMDYYEGPSYMDIQFDPDSNSIVSAAQCSGYSDWPDIDRVDDETTGGLLSLLVSTVVDSYEDDPYCEVFEFSYVVPSDDECETKVDYVAAYQSDDNAVGLYIDIEPYLYFAECIPPGDNACFPNYLLVDGSTTGFGTNNITVTVVYDVYLNLSCVAPVVIYTGEVTLDLMDDADFVGKLLAASNTDDLCYTGCDVYPDGDFYYNKDDGSSVGCIDTTYGNEVGYDPHLATLDWQLPWWCLAEDYKAYREGLSKSPLGCEYLSVKKVRVEAIRQKFHISDSVCPSSCPSGHDAFKHTSILTDVWVTGHRFKPRSRM